MTHRRLELGAAGEAHAAAHLERAGYRILARNARAAGVEIDIVAARGDLIVFVEVKARSSSAFGGAAAAVDARKQARLVRAATAWLHEQRPRARRARFDVITWEWQPERGWQLTHLEGAFEAGA